MFKTKAQRVLTHRHLQRINKIPPGHPHSSFFHTAPAEHLDGAPAIEGADG